MEEAQAVALLGVKFSVDIDERISMAEKVGNPALHAGCGSGRATELDSLLGVIGVADGWSATDLNLVYDLTKFRSKT
jgi:hypothetical protein